MYCYIAEVMSVGARVCAIVIDEWSIFMEVPPIHSADSIKG